jgi:hypothetical protein
VPVSHKTPGWIIRHVCALVVGTLILLAGLLQYHDYWRLKHHGTQTFGVLEQVIRRGSDYSFDVAYKDGANTTRHLVTGVNVGMQLRHTSGNTFTQHAIGIVFLLDNPGVAGLSESLHYSMAPLIVGSLFVAASAIPLIRRWWGPIRVVRRAGAWDRFSTMTVGDLFSNSGATVSGPGAPHTGA